MSSLRPRILYVTDLTYQARGRRYCDEDIYLSSRLGGDFDLALCHPRDAASLMDAFEAVVVRNSGPVLAHQDAWDAFRDRAVEARARVYNQLTGRGDMAGKHYLLDLTEAGYPVIPTVDRLDKLDRLPSAAEYVVKPKLGADSLGLRFLPVDALRQEVQGEDGEVLVQPRIAFAYEVSFYFVDHDFQYALVTPDPDRRWELVPYQATQEDLEFARTFIAWNTMTHGIQRVDACRAPDGALLLVELEDLNPYLSLDALDGGQRTTFVTAFGAALHRLIAG